MRFIARLRVIVMFAPNPGPQFDASFVILDCKGVSAYPKVGNSSETPPYSDIEQMQKPPLAGLQGVARLDGSRKPRKHPRAVSRFVS